MRRSAEAVLILRTAASSTFVIHTLSAALDSTGGVSDRCILREALNRLAASWKQNVAPVGGSGLSLISEGRPLLPGVLTGGIAAPHRGLRQAGLEV
jgi:hypothetical protein